MQLDDRSALSQERGFSLTGGGSRGVYGMKGIGPKGGPFKTGKGKPQI
jgi:hypothetical protein